MRVISSFAILFTLLGSQSSNAQDDTERRPTLRRRLNTTTTATDPDSVPSDWMRIVGGQVANANDYPWHINLVGCGGSLIASDVVLTAAHCRDLNPFSILIGGSTFVTGTPRFIQRGSETIHPDYSRVSNSHDFMLYKLTKPVTDREPVTLNNDANDPLPDSTTQVLTVIGFGKTDEDDSDFSFNLREVQVNHVPYDNCQFQYLGALDEDSMFCAGVSGGGKDSCQGDSGGPIIDQNGVLVGVTSFGNGCGKPGFPGVYARVSDAIGWIQRETCGMSTRPPAFCDTLDVGQVPTTAPNDSSTSGGGDSFLEWLAAIFGWA